MHEQRVVRAQGMIRTSFGSICWTMFFVSRGNLSFIQQPHSEVTVSLGFRLRLTQAPFNPCLTHPRRSPFAIDQLLFQQVLLKDPHGLL